MTHVHLDVGAGNEMIPSSLQVSILGHTVHLTENKDPGRRQV